MLATVSIDIRQPAKAATIILEKWRTCKVLHIKAPGLTEETVRDFYENLLPSLGTPLYIAEDVKAGDRHSQRISTLWTQVRFDPTYPLGYRHSKNAQPLHTDGSYVPIYPNASLMCCVRSATQGGETIFIDTSDLIEILLQEAPSLLSPLQSLPVTHVRSGDTRTLLILRHHNGRIRVNWNYHCVAENSSAEVLALRKRSYRFLRDSPGVRKGVVPLILKTGDAVTWKDDEVLHGRHAFRASIASERFLWKCAVDIGVFT
ncbi:MAG: TauD/TfdA family dioxygenase [Nitrososphaera sp.]|nr:TauD/TfdA family dioxygenase [Nitrososphaera sp.]